MKFADHKENRHLKWPLNSNWSRMSGESRARLHLFTFFKSSFSLLCFVHEEIASVLWYGLAEQSKSPVATSLPSNPPTSPNKSRHCSRMLLLKFFWKSEQCELICIQHTSTVRVTLQSPLSSTSWSPELSGANLGGSGWLGGWLGRWVGGWVGGEGDMLHPHLSRLQGTKVITLKWHVSDR